MLLFLKSRNRSLVFIMLSDSDEHHSESLLIPSLYADSYPPKIRLTTVVLQSYMYSRVSIERGLTCILWGVGAECGGGGDVRVQLDRLGRLVESDGDCILCGSIFPVGKLAWSICASVSVSQNTIFTMGVRAMGL